jgi:hypothetical protein
MESNLMPPFLMRSLNNNVGCAALKASTAFLHPAGMAVLTFGLSACAGAWAAALGAFAGTTPLRNFASVHVSIMSMVQSSTSLTTVPPRNDRGVGAGAAHRSHARKSWRAL